MTASSRTAAPDLASRYGRPRPWATRVLVAVCVVGGLVGGSWLVYLAWFHGTPSVSSQLVSWEVVDDDTVRVTFDVALDGDEVATCRARALSADHNAVGDLVVRVPTDAGGADGGVVEREFRTLRRATSVELVGCTTDSQQRPS
ncbi:DUF4307 domain-containing protein [Nocardioides sp. ChNu-153]|uniref:DUF4307 domain-containing protein n=1 Tax=Nocardioides sp. ChNu-153 TaxID=2779364 RepID=UPI002651F8CA|nr:DUF4307 domain-containing protein [Nocardioides sp. ChNu-153]MDN7120475.1 DUF4307 domain-containing protein [Nocardioides sp. ChNu-153]